MQTPFLPSFDFTTPENFDSVRDCIPSRLLALSAKGPALLGLEPGTVAIAGLAHLAAALGRSTLLDDGTASTPPAFSLAVLSDTPLPSNWLITIGRGWLEQVHHFKSLTPEMAQTVIRQQMNETAVRKPGTRTRDPQLDQLMDQIPEDVVNMLRLQFISTKVDPAAVSRALVQCRDHAVTLLDGAVDSLLDWSHLSPSKQRQWIEMVTLSWNARPVCITSQGAETLSSLTCLWQTRTEHLRCAWFSHARQAGQNPPPVLLFRQLSTPRRLPVVNSKEFVEWSQWLGAAFTSRLTLPGKNTIQLEEEVRQPAEKWFADFAVAMGLVSPKIHPWLRWLPDLALRLYHVLLIGRALDRSLTAQPNEQEKWSSTVSPLETGTVMSQAIRLTRWLSHEHYRVVQELIGQFNATEVSTAPETTDMAALQEDILCRLRDNGPLKRRDLQRTFHHLPAAARDRAIQCLKIQGAISESAAGELQTAA